MSNLDDFLKAVTEGNVETPLGDLEVATDGHARLLVGKVPLEHGFGNCVSICLVDSGGFSSLFVSKEEWAKMKIVVDTFLLEEQK